MTKVVQIQYSTSSAGSSAIRLHRAFIEANVESCILSLQPDINKEEGIIYLSAKSRMIARIDNRLQAIITRNKDDKYGNFSYPIIGTNIDQLEEVKNTDVVYIHWALGGFLTLTSIRNLAKLNKPVVIFMHDMWPITGGCHHSFTCDKYKTGCNNCQMFAGQIKNDLSAKGFKKKYKLYSRFKNLYFVSPSRWLLDCAKRSFLTKDKYMTYIPNLLDDTIFKPIEKKSARQILNIEQDEIVIGFGAISLMSPYKGWSYLQEALEILNKDNDLKRISILIFGTGYNKQMTDAIHVKTKFLGFLNDCLSKVVAYNAADVFVVPSLADNQPTTVMESLCCGTPVVGFEVGGIPDMISHKENGYLAQYKNSRDLAEGIKFCVNNRIEGKALPVFNKDLIIKSHLDLINKIVTDANE